MNQFAALLVSFFLSAAHAALVYTPPQFNNKTARIVVVIHGCLQTGESMALGTGWNQLADRENLLILYPQVNGSHPLGCWEWFLPENQRADSGQLKFVQDEIAATKTQWNVTNAPVYLVGMSSGAATVAGLLACFPKNFAGGAIHSGLPYGVVSDEAQAKELMARGPIGLQIGTRACNPKDFSGQLMVLQGQSDRTVNALNAPFIIDDFLTYTSGMSWRKFANNAFFVVTDYIVEQKLRARLLQVENMGHAWSGYNLNLAFANLVGPHGPFPTQLPFFEDSGPSATDSIWEFFNEPTERK